ncbi:hypothetical protein FIU86_07755 [Roseovarius sp. THAF9]|uniref:hypothetical protein n=1 Tax=Roseovarius sp. THAF9 TaxID=2587847 RepID=UPI001268EE68|nr:hypothetical protein [Roseovarius sp. THAF9]QFT92734.1 hypothetical protein FIU86_07755 [Roseovarius sp. THAF9]
MTGVFFALAILSILAAFVCNLTVGLTLRALDPSDPSGVVLMISPIGSVFFIIIVFVTGSILVASILAVPALFVFAALHLSALQRVGPTFDTVLGSVSNAACALCLVAPHFI